MPPSRASTSAGASRRSRAPAASQPIAEGVAETFLAHSDDLMLVFTADGTVTWASPSSERLFGLAPDALVGRNGFTMIHSDDQGRALEAFAGIPELGDHVRIELRVIDPAGRARWVEEVATNLLDEPGVGGVVAHLRDITERRAAEQAMRFQASLLDAAGQAIIARDLDGTTMYWNEAATDLFGWTRAEVVGRRLRDHIGPSDEHEGIADEANAAHLAGIPWSGEVDIVAKDGRLVHVHVSGTPVYDDEGRQLGTIAVSTDLTESIEQRQRVEDAHRRMADAQASAHLGSFELDLRTGALDGSDELWRILGRPPSNLERLEHVHPDDVSHVRSALRSAIEGSNAVAVTHRIVRPDGVVRWVVSRSSQFNSAEATILSGTMLDITERHEAEQALLHQATHDPLTGMVNRRLFVQRLEAILARDPFEAGGTVVLYVDLDDFKAVNDRIGHVDADIVLRRVGERLVEVVPPDGTVGRLGGDEFVICVDRVHHRDQVDAVATAVLTAIRRPLVAGDVTLSLDASIGIAGAAAERRAEALLRNADVAMYAAKQGGGGRAEVFDDALHRQDRRRRELADGLRTALDTGQIVAWFQPELHLATGRLFGFEALARWPHPDGGMVGPDEFIPLAEDTGLIVPLGRRMLESACEQVVRWRADRPDLRLNVGVNVSPLQLADPAFADDVRHAVATHGLAPGQLCLEVTESTLMDVHVAAESIRRLRALGATIAIDDFGTGYSSFSRLKGLPVDFLKIDQSFVADIGNSDPDDVIVSTMAGLAHSLGTAVIAEGIETEAQRRFLAELGCAYGQGYLWHRPLDPGTAAALVRSQPPVA